MRYAGAAVVLLVSISIMAVVPFPKAKAAAPLLCDYQTFALPVSVSTGRVFEVDGSAAAYSDGSLIVQLNSWVSPYGASVTLGPVSRQWPLTGVWEIPVNPNGWTQLYDDPSILITTSGRAWPETDEIPFTVFPTWTWNAYPEVWQVTYQVKSGQTLSTGDQAWIHLLATVPMSNNPPGNSRTIVLYATCNYTANVYAESVVCDDSGCTHTGWHSASSASVTVKRNSDGLVIGTHTADSGGNVGFGLPAGSYSVSVKFGGLCYRSASGTVTIPSDTSTVSQNYYVYWSGICV